MRGANIIESLQLTPNQTVNYCFFLPLFILFALSPTVNHPKHICYDHIQNIVQACNKDLLGQIKLIYVLRKEDILSGFPTSSDKFNSMFQALPYF